MQSGKSTRALRLALAMVNSTSIRLELDLIINSSDNEGASLRGRQVCVYRD